MFIQCDLELVEYIIKNNEKTKNNNGSEDEIKKEIGRSKKLRVLVNGNGICNV